MTAGGSQQLRLFRRARRDGDTLMTACVKSGIPLAEARLWDAEDRANPPGPECFELLGSVESILRRERCELCADWRPQPDGLGECWSGDRLDGDMTKGPAGWSVASSGCEAWNPKLNTAGTSPAKPEEDEMGRPRKKEGIINGEVPKPDFDQADEIYVNDIAPANKQQKQAMKDASDGWKSVKKDARVHVGGYRKAMQVANMEEAEQQAWLRSFNGGLKKKGVVLIADLVDQAQTGAQAGTEAVPSTTQRPKPTLVTINHPSDDSDLNPPDADLVLTVTNGEIVDHDPLGLGLGDDDHQQAAE